MNTRFLPLLLFGLLLVLQLVGLNISDHKTDIPSPLINKPVPAFDQPVLGNAVKRLGNAAFAGKPYLVNFWASWCVTCRVEHPVITELAKRKVITIVGMNFRDEAADAQAWLDHFGNPYDVVLTDVSGRLSIDFGVYAAPESFLVDPSGKIVYKQIGALTAEAIETEIMPRLAAMESVNQ